MDIKHLRIIILLMVETVATRKITVEVEVPEEFESDFVRTLRERVWELYLAYKWIQLPEADENVIEELAGEAKRRGARKKIG